MRYCCKVCEDALVRDDAEGLRIIVAGFRADLWTGVRLGLSRCRRTEHAGRKRTDRRASVASAQGLYSVLSLVWNGAPAFLQTLFRSIEASRPCNCGTQ